MRGVPLEFRFEIAALEYCVRFFGLGCWTYFEAGTNHAFPANDWTNVTIPTIQYDVHFFTDRLAKSQPKLP